MMDYRREEEQNRKRNALLQQSVMAAIPIILNTQLKDGECLYGVIKWNTGLVINPSRYPITQEQMQLIRRSLGSNNCVFRYFLGKPLELLY